MRNPEKYTAQEISESNNFIAYRNATDKNGEKWIPARPLGWQGFRTFHNIKLAWLVYIGKYDILDWEDYNE